jgi:hypothetical protein
MSPAWIRDAYLDADVRREIRARFRRERLVILDDFLRPERVGPIGRFLYGEATYDTQHTLYPPPPRVTPVLRAVHVSRDEWEVAPVDDRFFRFQRARVPLSGDGEASSFVQMLADFTGETFRDYFSEICGAPLGRAALEGHRMEREDFIRGHSDDRANRALGVALYASEQWRSEWGGLLEITEHDGSRRALSPRFNRLVVFDVAGHREHAVTTITGREPRLSLNGWFLKPEETGGGGDRYR